MRVEELVSRLRDNYSWSSFYPHFCQVLMPVNGHTQKRGIASPLIRAVSQRFRPPNDRRHGVVNRPVCNSRFRLGWSILLTFKNIHLNRSRPIEAFFFVVSSSHHPPRRDY